MNSPETLPAKRLRLAELRITNRFATLPGDFYTQLASTPLPSPYLVCASERAAGLIGLDPEVFADPEFIGVFSGNSTLTNSRPLAAEAPTAARPPRSAPEARRPWMPAV